ncbi:hypothetical protein NGB36_12080 [Streptomyces sp. RB6PN25]|uniref:non-specific serine/threonine protein kinase n=2 Tax=Streptomyces humicola TaxID=2953240 RepID=A0ABT1PUG9_9ACTN|nr:hypothetical protein [Streptomyces humicola]
MGHPPTPASDLWSLGATLYAAVEGDSPFRRSTTSDALQAVINERPGQARHAGPLAPVIEALLRKNPDHRPRAEQLQTALSDLATGSTATPPRPTAPLDHRRPETIRTAPSPPTPAQAQPPITRSPTTPRSAAAGTAGTSGPGPTGKAGHGAGQRRRQPRARLLIMALSLIAAVIGGGLSAVELINSAHNTQRPPATAQTNPPPAQGAPTRPPTQGAPTPAPSPPSNGGTVTPPAPPPASNAPTTPGVQQVVQDYYAAINAHDYARAWGLGGKNLGTSYDSFVNGFSNTASDSVTVTSVSGDTVSVKIDATQTDGSHRYFTGTYTVSNGTIASANIHQQ